MPRPITRSLNQDVCEILHEAFRVYREELESVVKDRELSDAVTMELSLVKFLLPQFFEIQPKNHGSGSITLDDDVWAFIRDIGHKYLSALEQRLTVAEATEHISGSVEVERKKVNNFADFIHVLDTEGLPDKKALIKDFFPQTPAGAPAAEQRTIVQVQVGDIYGSNVAVTGINNGEIKQNAMPDDLGELLKVLTQKILEAPSLTPEQRNDALGDIQTIQAQQTKAKPDKGIIKKATESLGTFADVGSIGQSAVTLAPYIHHLAHLIQQLHP